MKKQFKILVAVLFIGIGTSCTSYREYQPQAKVGDDVVVNMQLMTDEHKENLSQVLDFYQVDWKEENGKILINSDVDSELLWNYTTKANDAEWLRSHKVD